jgi:PBSX family phage terminase large subunit
MKMPISNKQKQILAFPFTKYDALIADGAIRSGKTVFMMVAFVDDAMRRFNNQRFGICGKTVDSTVKNIIMPYLSLVYAKEKYNIQWKRTDKTLVVSKGNITNTFEIFGGKDESSFALIQGRTLAGVLIDEVALIPRSFVEQACARCSVDGSKLWFNCNPASPQHWFYTEWVCKPKEHNALRLHFLLEDNPSLSQRIIDRYKSMYTGVFYNRYILGEWCVAEGLVYDFGEDNIVDDIPSNGEYYISIDYGTLNPFSAGLWCVLGDKATRIKEFYYDGRKKAIQRTDEEYCDNIDELAKGYNIRQIIVDPSAASFITALRKRGYSVRKANNDVLDGIRRTAVYLKNGNIKIHRSCVDAITEFGLYRWDDKATADTVIKENDHAMDEIRYFCNTIMKNKVGKSTSNYTPIFM